MSIEDSIVRLKLTHILCICLIGILIIRALVRRWKHRKIYAFLASLPGPIGFPFIGSLHLVIGITIDNIYEIITNMAAAYPRLTGFWVGETPSIFTSDPEIFNAILSSPKGIDKFSHYKHMNTGIPGIMSKQGEDWRSTRKMINPGFTASNFSTFDKNFQHHTRTFLQKLGERADGEEFDIFPSVHMCTIDFAIDNLGNHRGDVQLNNVEYVSSNMVRCVEMVMERAFQPWMWSDFMYRLTGKQKLYKEKFDPAVNDIQAIVQQRIEDAAQDDSSKEKAWACMDILLNNYEEGTISKNCVVAEIQEMLVAGSITTAIYNSWIFKMLAMHPDIQEKAFKEILENCNGPEVTPDDLSNLVFLEMVVKETLRHFVAPFVGRKISEDLRVNEKLTIPGGIEVFLALYEMHHDPEYWQRPGEFYPEHFSDEHVKSRPKGAYAPFLSGPRVCPGYKYAMRSMKLLLANTLLRYTFSTDEKPPKDLRDMKCRFVILPMPLSKFKVKVTPRPKHQSVTQAA